MIPDATIGDLLMEKGQFVYTITPEQSVLDALAIMAEKEVGALIVIESGRIAGMVSERDYARKVVLQGKASRATPVREIMTAPAITVTPDRSVRECMQIMTDARVRHLPVMDGGKLAGVVSVGDLVKWIITAQQHAITHLESYITGVYPA